MKPLLPSNYRVRLEPPDASGEEGLVFTSDGKRAVVRGHLLGRFVDLVVPLLDGRHTLAEIQEQVAETFEPGDLEATVHLLIESRIVEDAELARELPERLEPQLNYLRSVAPDPSLVLARLADAHVTVFGLGALGVVSATALAAAGVGRVRCVDALPVSAADPFLAQLYGLGDVGRPRAEAAAERMRSVNPAVAVELITDGLPTDEAVAEVVTGSDFVLACLDPGLLALTHSLNRACLSRRVPWTSAGFSAFEGLVGPTVIPYETACYVCYEQRLIAARDDPVDARADLRQLADSGIDTSGQRENLAFGAGIVGNLLALQAFQMLAGARPPTAGRILVVDFATAAISRHTVLRKPWCPACSR